MEPGISKKDWKRFKTLHERVTDSFWERVLAEAERIVSDSSRSPYERCEALRRLTEDRDRQFRSHFSEFSRSKAVHQLISMCSLGLIEAKDVAEFGPEIQEPIRALWKDLRNQEWPDEVR